MFSDPVASHQHSLETLDLLYEYDDFMSSVGTMCDMGCGTGLDLEWWATRTTRDENPQPLNIMCQGIDINPTIRLTSSHSNVKFLQGDFEDLSFPMRHRYDVIWCHDSFQYALSPLGTLAKWHKLMNPDAMLVLAIPQTTNIDVNELAFDQPDYVYYNWTMISLIHCLSVSGFDCANGYFFKNPQDTWLHAVVYRAEVEQLDPRKTRWYHLAESGLLPVSMVDSIRRHGYPRQRDLVLPWLDRSHRWLGEL